MLCLLVIAIPWKKLYFDLSSPLIPSEAAMLQFYFESFDYEEFIIFEEGVDIFLCEQTIYPPKK